MAIPRRFRGTFAREVWTIQERLLKRNVRSLDRLVTQKVQGGLRLPLPTSRGDESVRACADWWTEFQNADDSMREALIAVTENLPQKKSRQKKRRTATPSGASTSTG